jgi:hypothetical protein
VSSSIFSSSRHIGRGCAALAVAALFAAAAFLTGVELNWRRLGYRPSIKDGAELWSVQRQAADRNGPSDLALVGTSRLLIDIRPSVLSALLGRPVSQLAIDGSSPWAVLRDLAEDDQFRGSILCEILPSASFGMGPDGGSEEFVRHYHQRTTIADLETRAREPFQSAFAFLLPGLTLRQVVASFAVSRRLPPTVFSTTAPDRFRATDFTLVDAAAQERYFADAIRSEKPYRTPTDVEWRNRVVDVNAWVARIRQRGGHVVFLRMPSSGAVLEAEEMRFPSERYWKRFTVEVDAPSFEFRQYQALQDWHFPDGSHLDYRDTGAFTRTLASILQARGDI